MEIRDFCKGLKLGYLGLKSSYIGQNWDSVCMVEKLIHMGLKLSNMSFQLRHKEIEVSYIGMKRKIK